ncbi:MAG TPA: ABC transporter permease [Candidatus Limnocylindria bacterium]|nr:ABC transporter permease [Candidatus Limnocylindria bacterium]
MDEIRAAVAIARKDLRNLSRYRWSIFGLVFTPLYQGVIPAFLFGSAFAVGGRVTGLESTVGTSDLSGFIFLGGVVGALVGTAFWSMAMSLRNEMDMGTLEPTWLTPTRHDTIVLGRLVGGLAIFVASQVVMFTLGILFFGLRIDGRLLQALPPLAIAIVGMLGTAYLLAGVVLVIREANFFIDTTNFLYSVASGTAFPITLLPVVLQPLALALPTTYAMDLIRQNVIGARPLFDPTLEWAALIVTTVVTFPFGRWAFGRAEHSMRVRGTLGQY